MPTTKYVFGDKVFADKLNYVSRAVFKEVRKEAVDIGHDVRNDIIKSMRNTPRNLAKKISRQFARTGKTKKRKGKLFHYPSLPGNPPAIDKGELVGDIKVRTAKTEIEVGDVSVKHGEAMETGVLASKRKNLKNKKGKWFIEPRPWLKPAWKRANIKGRIEAAFRRGGKLR